MSEMLLHLWILLSFMNQPLTCKVSGKKFSSVEIKGEVRELMTAQISSFGIVTPRFPKQHNNV